jgi:hypothetical protein
MVEILPFLKDEAFDQTDITAMSLALNDICKELRLPDGDNPARRVIAERVIDLARCGVRSPLALRDRVLRETNLGHHLVQVRGAGM